MTTKRKIESTAILFGINKETQEVEVIKMAPKVSDLLAVIDDVEMEKYSEVAISRGSKLIRPPQKTKTKILVDQAEVIAKKKKTLTSVI